MHFPEAPTLTWVLLCWDCKCIWLGPCKPCWDTYLFWITCVFCQDTKWSSSSSFSSLHLSPGLKQGRTFSVSPTCPCQRMSSSAAILQHRAELQHFDQRIRGKSLISQTRGGKGQTRLAKLMGHCCSSKQLRYLGKNEHMHASSHMHKKKFHSSLATFSRFYLSFQPRFFNSHGSASQQPINIFSDKRSFLSNLSLMLSSTFFF